MKKSLIKSEKLLGMAFTFPLFILIFIIIGFPFFYTIILSFTDKRIGYPEQFIGLKNYINLVSDSLYWLVLKNTFIYTFSCIAIKLILGMIFALVLNEKFWGRSFVRVSLLLPWAIPGMVAAHTWRWMFNDQYGIINELLLRLNIINEHIPFLSSVKLTLISVMIVNVWRGIPFFLFSFLGALQIIDKELYDAGKVDGANIIQRFLHITIPSIAPVIFITTILSSIWTFNDFDNIWLITGGGPLNSSSVIATYTYETAFINNEMGQALAIAVSVVPVILVLIIFAARKLNADKE